MAAKETPVMQQHAAAKRAHPDCIVFFRLGDFYEMFGEDAVVCARVLELTLTSRNKGKPDEIPMAGVPHHAALGYIARMLERGYKVAICEQMADPATVKGIVPRQVVRVITPGTWTETEVLEPTKNNWLASVAFEAGKVGVCLLDLSTSEMVAASAPDLVSAAMELVGAAPRELLLVREGDADEQEAALGELLPKTAFRRRAPLPRAAVEAALEEISLGADVVEVRAAVAGALAYAKECLAGASLPVYRVGLWNREGVLGLDPSAQRHLELVESSSGDDRTTLLSTIDRTKTAMGARLLRRRLLLPLLSVPDIRRRHDAVEALTNSGPLRAELGDALAEVTDLERLAVRISLGEATPRDLGALRRGLEASREIADVLGRVQDPETREVLGLERSLDLVEDLCDVLSEALVERPPALSKEGAIFRPGFDPELDRLAELRQGGTDRMGALEERLRAETGIGNLRIRFTRVFGWYVEVSRTNAAKVPASFRRKQTVATGERYTFDELDQLAYAIDSAETDHRIRELSLLEELLDRARREAPRVHRLAAFVAELDVHLGLADLAVDSDYVRPLVEESDVLELTDARHPVVEKLAARGRFVPNDVALSASGERLWLVTGPNMAGKSTFLRQIALSVILAQMGSFVPAKSARIGIVDRVLSRVGASDNLAAGESTFMVEMRETANILRSATKRSLVILDEIGRGTSTFDGLSIAWAVVEYLDQVAGCRTLFATHYHELTELGEAGPHVANYSVSAKEHGEEVIFLHRVLPGRASRSYGIAVAKLAGVPELVLGRARALLAEFEGSVEAVSPRKGPLPGKKQLDLFQPPSASDPNAKDVLETIRALELDRLTGLEALTLLSQFQKKLVY